jgi:hypothetical protein
MEALTVVKRFVEMGHTDMKEWSGGPWVRASDYDELAAELAEEAEAHDAWHELCSEKTLRVEALEAVLWDIQEFTRGYDDIAGIVHRKARAALTPRGEAGGVENG